MKPKTFGIFSGCLFGFLTFLFVAALLALISWGLWEVGVREIGGIKNNAKTMMPIAIGISAFAAIIVGILAGRFFYWWRQNRGMKPKSDRLFSPKTFGIFSGCSFGLLTFLFGTPLLVYIPIYLWDVRPLEFKENLSIAIGISAFLAIIVGILAGRFFYWWRQKKDAHRPSAQSA